MTRVLVVGFQKLSWQPLDYQAYGSQGVWIRKGA